MMHCHLASHQIQPIFHIELIERFHRNYSVSEILNKIIELPKLPAVIAVVNSNIRMNEGHINSQVV
jgi:hypothetical protein